MLVLVYRLIGHWATRFFFWERLQWVVELGAAGGGVGGGVGQSEGVRMCEDEWDRGSV